MKVYGYSSYLCAGVLVLTLGLVGCGKAQGSASGVTSSAASSSSEQKAPQTLYWRGTTSTGETFYFMEDEAAKTAEVLIVASEETDAEPFHAEGNYTLAADGTATITPPEESEDSSDETERSETSEKADPYVFHVTDVNASSLLIDAGEHGKATLTPITADDHKDVLVAYGYAQEEEPSEEPAEDQAEG